jgi:AraC-like DNA-binding protein
MLDRAFLNYPYRQPKVTFLGHIRDVILGTAPGVTEVGWQRSAVLDLLHAELNSEEDEIEKVFLPDGGLTAFGIRHLSRIEADRSKSAPTRGAQDDSSPSTRSSSAEVIRFSGREEERQREAMRMMTATPLERARYLPAWEFREELYDRHGHAHYTLTTFCDDRYLDADEIGRRFEEWFGEGARSFALAIRMEHACVLLAQKPLVACDEVAYKLGYMQTTDFRYAFKQYWSIPPGRFQREAQFKTPAAAMRMLHRSR